MAETKSFRELHSHASYVLKLGVEKKFKNILLLKVQFHEFVETKVT
jgi:hypothetical protein